MIRRILDASNVWFLFSFPFFFFEYTNKHVVAGVGGGEIGGGHGGIPILLITLHDSELGDTHSLATSRHRIVFTISALPQGSDHCRGIIPVIAVDAIIKPQCLEDLPLGASIANMCALVDHSTGEEADVISCGRLQSRVSILSQNTSKQLMLRKRQIEILDKSD